MDEIIENDIRQEQIESFGRLMAGFSHDMKNHLGIIRESNGLMGDLIEMGGFGDDQPSADRLKKAISSIEGRVVIAANMLHHLSGLAHRPDSPLSSFHINDLIVEECAFLERFSKLKQISLALELGEGLTAIYNDPSLLQHIIYRVYILCLEQLSAGHSLVIISEQNKKNTGIIFRLNGNPQVDTANLFYDNLLAAVKKLKGILGTGTNSKDYTDIILAIPSLVVTE